MVNLHQENNSYIGLNNTQQDHIAEANNDVSSIMWFYWKWNNSKVLQCISCEWNFWEMKIVYEIP